MAQYANKMLEKAQHLSWAEVGAALGISKNTAGALLRNQSLFSHRTALAAQRAGFCTYDECAAYTIALSHARGRTPPAWTDASRAQELQKIRIRHRSRKLHRADRCSVCGGNYLVERHHPSYESSDVQILCRLCHAASHMADATWGHGRRPTLACVICGKPYSTKWLKRVKTCGPACRGELLSRLLKQRWAEGAMARRSKVSPP